MKLPGKWLAWAIERLPPDQRTKEAPSWAGLALQYAKAAIEKRQKALLSLIQQVYAGASLAGSRDIGRREPNERRFG